MTKTFAFGSLLLLSSALCAPSALAQSGGGQTGQAGTAETPPAAGTTDQAVDPATGEPVQEEVEVSIPGADPVQGSEIVVTGSRGPQSVLRRTPQVLSILSQEDIARTGEGDIAGALSRVTGLSVVGNGFVFVRGLGDRYSLALLNGSPLPSPEPLRRVVPLDIFPTSIIASSLVQKTYSANFPGEFGGGVINLTTRAIPDENFLSIGVSTSANTETTFQLGYTYYGSDLDFLGFDDGARDAPPGLLGAVSGGDFNTATTPAQRRDFAASLTNAPTTVLQVNRDIPANVSASLSGGLTTNIGESRLGMIAAFGYSNNWRTRDTIQQSSLDPNLAGDPQRDFRTVITDNRIIVNGLLGFGFEFGEHQLRWTNLYIRDTLKQGRLSSGENRNVRDPQPGLPPSIIEQNTYWFERQLIDTQFVGEFDFGNFEVDVRGTYAKTQRESPYERDISYLYLGDGNPDTKSVNDVDDYVNRLGGGGQFATVAFSDLDEDVLGGGVDLTYRMPDQGITFTGGYSYTDQSRVSSRYVFDYFRPGGGLPVEVAQQRPDFLLSDFNIYTQDIQLRDVSGAEGTAAYSADLIVHAGYLQFNFDAFEGLNISGGLRYETAEQTVRPIGNFTPTVLDNDYFLPAVTATYAFAQDFQLRLHASKTIARPQFRELAQQLFQDFESDREFTGNPFLEDSELRNFEGRLEWYPRRNERVAASVFYKEIENPIEAAAFFAGGGQLRTGFANAPLAELYGAEFELQTYIPLDFIGGSFFDTRRILVIGNYTYTQSEVMAGNETIIGPDLQPLPANTLFREGAPLTGQSDHLYNLQISLEDTDRLSQLTFLATYASERVTNRGPIQGINRQPDIIEEPGFRFDVVARQALPLGGVEGELQFEVRNIFGEDYVEFQQAGSNFNIVNAYDIGTTFSLGLNIRF